MLAFIFVMAGLFFLLEANLYRFFLLLVYICIFIEDPIIRGGGWDPIYCFNPATSFVPVPNQDLYFQCYYVLCLILFSMVVDLLLIMVELFIDIANTDFYVSSDALNFIELV